MKKALKETQTLRAGCSKAEPKIFAPNTQLKSVNTKEMKVIAKMKAAYNHNHSQTTNRLPAYQRS